MWTTWRAIVEKRRSGPAGFTIVELLVTLMVLLVLSSVAIPSARFALKRQKEEFPNMTAPRDILKAQLRATYCDMS